MTGSHFLDVLRDRVLLVDGAMGTLLHDRGWPESRGRERANLERPSLVLSIHEDYLRAGADILETNTFGANAVQLARYGLEHQVAEINRIAVQLARSVARHREGVLVAGSVGPLGVLQKPYGWLSFAEAVQIYEEQIRALVESGVDLLFIETQASVVDARAALTAARRCGQLPVVCLLTCDAEGRTRLGNLLAPALTELARSGADIVGFNCTIGPQDALELVVQQLQKFPYPLCVMPNAGYPALISGRPTFVATPAYFAHCAEELVQHGIHMVGSCCGTGPEHTAAIARVLRGRKPIRTFEPVAVHVREPILRDEAVRPPAPARAPRRLTGLLRVAKVVTVKVDPPRGWDAEAELKRLRSLELAGFHAINISDNPMARVRMSAVAFAALARRETGLEPILHFSCRNRNLLAIQSELLGAAALGIRVILAMTGEPVRFGEFPEATPVSDVDSLGLIRIVRAFNEGRNIAGRPLDRATHFLIGCVANPWGLEHPDEAERLRAKLDAGAHFVLTTPLYERDSLQRLRDRVGSADVEVVMAVLPPVSLRHLRFLANEIPGIRVPAALMNRMSELAPEDVPTFVADYFQQLVDACFAEVDGFYFMPPGARYDLVEAIWAPFRFRAKVRGA